MLMTVTATLSCSAASALSTLSVYSPFLVDEIQHTLQACVNLLAQQLEQYNFIAHCLTHNLRGATGGVDTVSPDFLVMDNRRIMPPKDALLASEPSRETASCRLQINLTLVGYDCLACFGRSATAG